jgi:proteasome lid subunit RPN8/RPN11
MPSTAIAAARTARIVAAMFAAIARQVARAVTSGFVTLAFRSAAPAAKPTVPTVYQEKPVMIAPRRTRLPKHRRPTRRRRRRRTLLQFSPTAWAKLLYLRDLGPTEIGGFGITDEDNPLLVTDFVMPDQVCTPTTVEFTDEGVADFVDSQVDRGRCPADCLRIWIHTHPGGCPLPSPTDEATFAHVFGETDWSVMFILARSGASYGRLQIQEGPHVVKRLSVSVDYTRPFAGSDQEAWQAELEQRVSIVDPFGPVASDNQPMFLAIPTGPGRLGDDDPRWWR